MIYTTIFDYLEKVFFQLKNCDDYFFHWLFYSSLLIITRAQDFIFYISKFFFEIEWIRLDLTN